MQTTVYTKSELKEAMKSGIGTIICKGDLAKKIIKQANNRKLLKSGLISSGIVIAAGIMLAPLTGGTSLIGSAAAAGAAITVGSVTVTTTELIILCGFTLGMAAMIKDYKKITFKDGSVTIQKD